MWANSVRSATVTVDHRVPAAEAIRVLRAAGGVVSMAHPPDGTDEATLAALRDLGLGAVEVAFPAATVAHATRLREFAAHLGLAVTGGSDCHGPGHPARAVGTYSISAGELDALRKRTSN